MQGNTKRRPRLFKWIFRLLSGISVAVIYFVIFSLFFDTPIESEIKKSTHKIEQEYQALSERYDTLLAVLDNVTERDANVYKTLFEAEPTLPTGQDGKLRVEAYDTLNDLTNKELGERFDVGMSALYQKVSVSSAKAVEREKQMITDVDKWLCVPSIQPVENRNLKLLTASFGDRIQPFFKTMTHHDGVDYSVPEGTSVFATADGVVESTQTKGQTSGLSITINHGNGYRTTYSHLSKAFIPRGRRVKRGDIIAFSGNSGLSFAPHLHYKVSYKSKPIDPLNFFFMELDMKQSEQLKQIANLGMQSFD